MSAVPAKFKAEMKRKQIVKGDILDSLEICILSAALFLS